MRLLLTFVAAALMLPGQVKSPAKDTAGGDPMVDLYRSLADWSRKDEKTISAIRDQVGNDREVAAVLFVTRRSSASPNQVMAARKSGKSWDDIARQWTVNWKGSDFIDEANLSFLSQYHGRTVEEVRKMARGAVDPVALNQEFRREGGEAKGNEGKGATTRTRKSSDR